MLIRGRCHCGNVAFDLDWGSEAADIPARACGCSFCVKHGGVWTSNPHASLAVSVTEPALLSRYAFGTRTATFHVCARCGAVPLVTSDIDGRLYSVVNVNTFDDEIRSRVGSAPADFEGEELGGRLARRQRSWIASVEYDSR